LLAEHLFHTLMNPF